MAYESLFGTWQSSQRPPIITREVLEVEDLYNQFMLDPDSVLEVDMSVSSNTPTETTREENSEITYRNSYVPVTRRQREETQEGELEEVDLNPASSHIDFSKCKALHLDKSGLRTFLYVANRMKEAGYNKKLIAGVLANIYYESSGNFRAVNSSKHWGLCLWQHRQGVSGRKDSLKSLVDYLISELNINGFSGVNTESRNGFNENYFNMFHSAKSADEAALAFSEGYERHGEPKQTRLRRLLATKIYNSMI